MYLILIDSSDRLNGKVSLIKYQSLEKIPSYDEVQKDLADNRSTVIDFIEGTINSPSVISLLLDRHKLRPSDIEFFVPKLGPGSFTGLKVGTVVSNIFNWWNKKVTLDKLWVPEYGREPNISIRKRD